MNFEQFVDTCNTIVTNVFGTFSWEDDTKEAVTYRAVIEGQDWSATIDFVRRKPRVTVRNGVVSKTLIVEQGTVTSTIATISELTEEIKEGK